MPAAHQSVNLIKVALQHFSPSHQQVCYKGNFVQHSLKKMLFNYHVCTMGKKTFGSRISFLLMVLVQTVSTYLKQGQCCILCARLDE